MEFFADRNLGVNIFPAILRAKGIAVQLHQDHFPQDAADVDWMPEVARRGPGAAVFCLAGGHLTGEEKAHNFLRCLPQILSILDRTPPLFIAKVYQPNRDDPADATTRSVDVKLTLADWEKRRG